jgi:predicted phosphodiesterase
MGVPSEVQSEEAKMKLGVRIGVCSDVHGRHDRLLAVLRAMAAAGVDERWCLGDLVGSEPVTPELVGAARQLDLLIAGNHDAWALGPDRVTASGRDVFRLASRATASRHGIDCWHGSPRHALLGFLTEASAARILPDRPPGSLGLVGHTHEPALFTYDGATTCAVRPVPVEQYDWLGTGACMANPGAICGNPRDAASWWLIVDTDARMLRWQREEH